MVVCAVFGKINDLSFFLSFFLTLLKMKKCKRKTLFLLNIEINIWNASCTPPPPAKPHASQQGSSLVSQLETSMLRRRNVDHPRCW